jgi:hypothetical protein
MRTEVAPLSSTHIFYQVIHDLKRLLFEFGMGPQDSSAHDVESPV